ncbi:SPOR domain-containing protein [Campylobacter majalis]|uniref:SPOR domain-containing protein n=1 Tax=Campylobacter majalis TaxID=2790656 RepID=UPI003D68721B
MQTQNELKDILLDKEDDIKSAKIKKLLVTIAAFSILFLVVIAAMKILNTDDNVTNNDIDSRLILPPIPETSDQNSIAPIVKDEKRQSDQLFEQVPIIPEEKAQDDFEEMVKKLKNKETPKPDAKEETKPIVVEKQTVQQENIAQASKEQEVKKSEIKQQVVPKSEAPKQIQTTQAQKPDTKSTQNKTETKPAVATQSGTNATPGAYVQVSSTSKLDPNSAELKKILSKGYTYKTLKVGNTYKILIGPFDSSKLQGELSNIRKEIKKDAFVYRVK